ncbi:SR-related and CTD-associated factor 4 [Cydia strobilella]|uniref:SR-related and CTD-associated factor 4 n=1 Tax=Cydia strobilella TaxID=1100964 RepID=UPI00300759EC
MDMPEVKAFNAELSGLYDNKPPISKAKMSAITRGAIKAIKFYKHVVHSVEKFIQKCKPEYKVPGLYVIDSIVRQSRHQFGQDKDVFAPRFAKNMQQTFANLFRCPPENKGNIIRVLNLWQKNNVFGPEVIQPLMDMADPNHPLHQEIQQQQNNTANGSSLTLNTSHNSDKKISPVPAPLHTPPDNSPMGDSFQDQPSGNQGVKFNRKLLSNDFEYESDDDGGHDTHTSHATHSTHSTHASHSTHTQPQQTADTLPLGSILTNPEIMRQLQSLQAQMQLMTGMSGMQIPNLMPMMSELQQNQNQPFLNKEQQKQNESKDDMVESDIEFVETGPQVIEIPDANDSRSPSPRRRHRSRSRSRGGRRRRTRSRSRSSRSPRRRRDKERDRERDRDRTKDNKSHKEREADKEKQREREKKGLPPIKKENLSVCSTTLWVGHLSKLATQEELSDLFGAVGGVTSIDVVAPRGCAFVVMERRRDAHKALTTLNKHKLHSKEIAVAWAPGKGVKGREWKDYWEAELGVSYLPWGALQQRWALGALSLDALEDGGAVDEETLPPWLPPRVSGRTTGRRSWACRTCRGARCSSAGRSGRCRWTRWRTAAPWTKRRCRRGCLPGDAAAVAASQGKWKDYWEAELGVSYLPWGALQQRWALGALSLDALEDGVEGLLGGGAGRVVPAVGRAAAALGARGAVAGRAGGRRRRGRRDAAAVAASQGKWKDYWEAELGVSYLPWGALQQRWALGALSLDALEDGGAVDEETLPPWLPPRILPKTLMDGMVGMMPMGMPGPAGMPPMPNAMPNPLQNAMPNAMQNAMPNAMPGPMPGMPALQLPPPGMGPGLPPGMPPGMPPGLRPPNMPQQVPGMQPEAGMPPTSALLRFPGMPPQPIQSMQSMPQPGMAALPGFLGGLLAVGGLVGGVPLHHAPPQHQQMQQRVSEVTRTDDAMDLDTEDTHNEEVSSEQPPPLSDQLQALLSKPPPGFNSSEPPPPFNLSEPPPTAPNTEDKQDDKRDRDRRDRDRDRRDRGDRDRRDRERGNRDRERGGRDRDRDRGDRDRERDRDRGGRDRRDRDRDRDNRDRFNAPRDNNNREQSRSKSPREGGAGGEKSLQERLWEMANGKRDEFPQPQQQDNIGPEENRVDRPPLDRMPRPGMDGEGDAADDWRRVEGPHAPPFRPDPRMRGPRPPVRGPWMEQGPGGPGGPGGQGPPFGARFNGLGPPPGFPGPGPGPGPRFERPPFARMPFDGPARPPFDGGRPPFDGPRPPFDGPRPPFDGPRFDGPRAPFDGPRPPFDGNRPPFDGPRPPFDGPRPPFDGPRPPFDGPRPFDGPFDGERPFDGPPEFFNNRRFEDREFNDRGWNGDRERGDRDWNDRRTDWDDRRRDRFRDKDNEDRSGQDRFDRNRNDRRRNFDDRNDRDRDRSDRDRSDRDKSDRDKSDRDRPKREERSRADRQKDRKSRWGAAEELKEGETSTEAAEAPKESTEAPKEVSTEQPEQMDIRSNQEQNVETKEPARNQRVESKEQASECAPMETESTIDTHQEREPVEIETKQYEEAPESQSFDDSQQAEEPANREETRESYEERVEVPMDEPREETRTFEAAPVSEVTETPDLYDANDAVDTSFSIAPEKNETEDRIESTETENRIVSTEESKSEDIFEPSKGEP